MGDIPIMTIGQQSGRLKGFRLPSEADKVPISSGGIYLFTLRFPTNYELSGENNEDLLRFNIRKYLSMLSDTKLSGTLSDPEKARHLHDHYSLSANVQLETCLSVALDDTVLSTIPTKELISLLQDFFFFLPPIYVGLAYDQSLSERLSQHLGGQTQFSSRLRDSSLSWHELYYYCMPIENWNRTQVRYVETLFQAYAQPKLSQQ